MSNLSQLNTESTVMAENTGFSMNWGAGSKSKGRAASSAPQNDHSLPPICKKKVLKIRQQLAEGIYGIDERLNIALDRLLEELVA